MTPVYGNYGIFLILGNAGIISSTVLSGQVANSVAMIFSFPDMEMADGTSHAWIRLRVWGSRIRDKDLGFGD